MIESIKARSGVEFGLLDKLFVPEKGKEKNKSENLSPSVQPQEPNSCRGDRLLRLERNLGKAFSLFVFSLPFLGRKSLSEEILYAFNQKNDL